MNGRYALTFYAPDGSVAYKIGQDGTDIPASAESFTPVGMYKFTGLPTTYAALTTAQKSTASSLIKTNSSRSGGIITVSLTMATKYLYDAGNNASTPTNAPYNGYKDSNSDRTANVSDGWYGLDFSPKAGVSAFYGLVFIEGGKIVTGSNTYVEISFASTLVTVSAEVVTVPAGAKDRHYAKVTLSEAVGEYVTVYWTITRANDPSVIVSGFVQVSPGQLYSGLSDDYLETDPVAYEMNITINAVSPTDVHGYSDGLQRKLTY